MIEELAGYFDQVQPDESEEVFLITCRTCGKAWRLRNQAPGNILRLLDHAASHEVPHTSK